MLSQTPAADDAYRCMRDSCGAECGLPVCKVDPAAVLVQTAECDGCFSSSCCSELNACYANRACKLTVECIVKRCGPALGASLSGLPIEFPEAGSDAGAFNACAEAGVTTGAPPPDCVRSCLCEYMQNDQGLPPREDSQRAPLLALAVYVCGQRAGCGSHCSDAGADLPDAPSDGDSDAPPDAASDAH